MRKTYTVKDIAEFTGLSESKIRGFIKSGSLKGERVKTANDAGRTVTRLEVAEEDLAAFALANYELVGPLMDMDFMHKYNISEVENGDPTDDAVEAENDDPTNNDNEEDTAAHPDGNWEDPAEADFDSDDDADTAEQPNEEMDVTDVNTSNSLSKNAVDNKEKMLLELRELKNVFEENLATFEHKLASANEAVKTATHAVNWTRGVIDNLDMVIDHISKNM